MAQLIDILTEKCPKCGKGQVFYKKGNPLLFQMPRMNAECSCCGHHFEKETGYFFGSMYVSYGLAVAEMVAVFFITFAFTKQFSTIITIISAMAILLSTFNFRLSRMLWIYMLDGPDRQV